MPKMKSFPQQPANFTNSPSMDVLLDIAQKIQIKSGFCIEHSNYKPYKLPVEVVRQLQQLPIETREKYLSQQLQFFLYGVYYSGFLIEQLLFDGDSDTFILGEELENSTFLEVDREFYDRLDTSNNGIGYFDPGWQVVGIDSGDGSLVVIKNGLTLHIERNAGNEKEFSLLQKGSSISIRLPKSQLQNGFYIAVGNAGLFSQDGRGGSLNTVRVYFNLMSEGASSIMHDLTKQINEAIIPFYFKTLYNPSDYSNRCDCAILYFERRNYHAIKSVLESIYVKHQAYFQNEVPLFTKMLAPGLALAEEPARKFSERESFGQNRCQIVARGLLEAKQKGIDNLQEQAAIIIQNFSSLEIDPQRPYLNANSEDIYVPLDL